MPEYAVALELHVDKLELTGDVQSLPSKITMPTDTASAATTSVRKNNLTEMKALAINLAAVNALQKKHLALALVRLTCLDRTAQDVGNLTSAGGSNAVGVGCGGGGLTGQQGPLDTTANGTRLPHNATIKHKHHTTMATTTNIVAINKMVTVRFNAAFLDCIVGQLSPASVCFLVEKLAPISPISPQFSGGASITTSGWSMVGENIASSLRYPTMTSSPCTS